MFTSDHGPWYQGDNGVFHGRKGETWDGGVRVPFLARFPGHIPTGRVVDGLATNLDIFPTVARLAGAPLPSAPLDGVDIWPMLTQPRAGASAAVERDVFLYFDSAYLQCARMGPWKLHVARYNTPPWLDLPANFRQNLPLLSPELYNLETDPGEHYDASGDHPDVVAAIRARIEALIPTFPAPVPSLWKSLKAATASYTPAGGWPG